MGNEGKERDAPPDRQFSMRSPLSRERLEDDERIRRAREARKRDGEAGMATTTTARVDRRRTNESERELSESLMSERD